MPRPPLPENGKSKLSPRTQGLEPATKHGLAVVFLFALGLITALAFFDLAGVVGENIRRGLELAVGWGAYGVPVGFLVLAYACLQPNFRFNWLRLVGLVLLLAGVTGLFHSVLPPSLHWLAASQGRGGGYLGFFSF